MINFQEGEWWKIAGRGWVFATKMPEAADKLLHTEVLIQGHQYYVVGVEMFAVNDSSLYKGRPVGVLVRGDRKDG